MKSIYNRLIRREMGITILSNQKLYMNPLHQVELKSNSKAGFLEQVLWKKNILKAAKRGGTELCKMISHLELLT